MSKINLNGQTIADKTTGKTSAKKAENAIGSLINILGNNMDEHARQNASTIATIAALFS